MEPLDLEVALSEMKPTVVLPAFSFDCLLFNINPVLLFPFSHAVALRRDVEKLQEIKRRVNVLPLGRFAVSTC